MRGVGRGLATGDGEPILRGGQKLVGGVVGGVAGAGARLTHSLHSVLRLLTLTRTLTLTPNPNPRNLTLTLTLGAP